ncbi:MFS transporter [Nonomuraea sp. SBT364]|uniref:MFS transporter n=1 Tax=Nonomuraea sp. SBT364 TaxID=1580530 RepID=UPI00066DC1C9|nr:MFS transporter [Nonomuraea sp. SBT364]
MTTGSGWRAGSAERRGALVLPLLCAVQFMVILDTTIANVALPSIGREFSLPEGDLQYVITLYAVAFGGFLILSGRLGDLLGRRRLFIGGTALFVASSAGCGLAAHVELLLAARTLQGLGAALISATALSLLLVIHAEGPGRNRALGIWSGLGATGAGAGLILGGVLTDTLGWRAVFLVNVPIGAVALLLTAILPRDGQATWDRAKLDLPGAVTITAGIGLLIYGLSLGQQTGFSAPATAGVLAAAVVLLTAFVLIQRRSASPLVPLRIAGRGPVAGANLAIICLTAVMGGQGFFMILYMQGVLGYSSLQTGLAVLPSAMMAVIGSTLASRLTAKVPPWLVAVAGLAMVAAGELLLAGITVHGTYLADLLPGYLLFGLGLAAAFVGASIVGSNGASAEDHGAVSGLLNTAQQVGIALGVATLVTLAVARTGAQNNPAATTALVAGYRFGLLASAVLAAAGGLALLLLRKDTKADAGERREERTSAA